MLGWYMLASRNLVRLRERERERKICIYREREKPGSWLLQFTHWGCGEYKHNIHTNSHKKSNAMLYKKERGGKSEQ